MLSNLTSPLTRNNFPRTFNKQEVSLHEADSLLPWRLMSSPEPNDMRNWIFSERVR